jgi:hypothetical protein
MEKLFTMTMWGRDDYAPNGYAKIGSTTVKAINGFEAAKSNHAHNRYNLGAHLASR